MELRAYQADGLAKVEEALTRDVRVVAVAPTGSGKGTMATALLARYAAKRQRGLFIVHRREIVIDIVKRLHRVGVNAAPIMPGSRGDDSATVQVASLQTLLASGKRPKAKVVVFDECHHYAADEWSGILGDYDNSDIAGFTATPQRSDGRPLGDVFQELIVVATYRELIAAGHIVDCAVLRPKKFLGIDLAQDPVEAYLKFAKDRPAFVFARRVAAAHELARRFNEAGAAAACVEATTGKSERDDMLKRLRDGSLTVVTNVFALTEGTDVPRVDTIVLARPCEHASTFVQMVGRGLRARRGKRQALLLDLTGVSHKHGMPTAERLYSLEGNGMGDIESAQREGREWVDATPEVLGLDLVPAMGVQPEVTPDIDMKREYWAGLIERLGTELRLSDAVEEYNRAFGERPPASMIPESAAMVELARLQLAASAAHLPSGIAERRFEQLFGFCPQERR